MKILIVNASDIQGGAARAAYRLHKALLAQNIDSQMLVQSKSSDDYRVIGPTKKINNLLGIVRAVLDQIPNMLYKNRTKTYFSPSWLPFSNIVDKINEINPDIVHLHWICGGTIKIEDMAKIKAPIVWSLHDMWAFTGGCHYNEECGLYQKNCGNCKVLGSDKEKDLSRKIFKRKQKTFLQVPNMTIVALSRWLEKSAHESSLLDGRKIINLPNPIDTTVFIPFDKKKARELWHLQMDKKLILFGAVAAISDPRKGFKELNKAIHNLKSQDIELVIFGSSEPQKSQNFGFKTHYLGPLHDDVSLVTLYNAVDIVVVPSLQEAFGQIASESMSCGTPAIAFAHTGLLDIIDHKINGYLAKPFDTDDLANGIEWVLNTPKYEALCKNAIEKVMNEFDSVVVSQKYIKLYQEVLGI